MVVVGGGGGGGGEGEKISNCGAVMRVLIIRHVCSED